MKIQLLLSGILIVTLFQISCKRDDSNDIIVYHSINKEFVLIRNTADLDTASDPISLHVDSIVSGLIDEQIISTGLKSFDLDQDNVIDFQFEIIDLNKFNNGNLPDTLDSLAACVSPLTLEVLDNSTHGYPDALSLENSISDAGNWSGTRSVLGTFQNAGQFNGQGEKFLGFRLKVDGDYKYGWVRLYCSEHNDTLRVIDYAYNDNINRPINAGQTYFM